LQLWAYDPSATDNFRQWASGGSCRLGQEAAARSGCVGSNAGGRDDIDPDGAAVWRKPAFQREIVGSWGEVKVWRGCCFTGHYGDDLACGDVAKLINQRVRLRRENRLERDSDSGLRWTRKLREDALHGDRGDGGCEVLLR